jgi:hypothetical protein
MAAMSDGPTCPTCGTGLITGTLTGGTEERVCPTCDPDHPLSVAIWNEEAKRDPLLSGRMTLEIYGNDLPATEVWSAVSRFIRDTFNADWSVDLIIDEEDRGEPS